MNDHPEELLAAYVEGTLGSDERALVDAHLSTCDRCREEVPLAGEARTALVALPELEPPAGVPLAVRRVRRGIPPKAWRYVGTAAAAAVLAAGAIFGLSKIDLGAGDAGLESSAPEGEGQAPEPQAEGEQAFTDAESAPAKGSTALDAAKAPSLPTYVETRRDYETNDLAPLARKLRDEAHEALDAGAQRTARAFFASFDPADFTVPVRQAIRCVLTEVPPEQLVVPFRIEAASFEGQPAYVAAFLQGPTPEEPYDRLVIWVVDRESCSLQSLASQLL
jgi:Putative zinc-finger